MKQKIPTFLLVLIYMFSSSCGRSSVSPQDYVRYIENPDNGLLLSSRVNGVKYTLQYQPTDYLVMLELRSFSIPSEIFKEQYNRFKGIEHYVFRIDKRDMDSLTAKAKDTLAVRRGMTEYLDFKIRRDIKLVEGNDTIPCGIAECESSAGMLPYYSFVLGFNTKEYRGDREFIYENKMIGTGLLKLVLKNSNVKRIPKLKTNR
jgi:hypothetical protein